VDVRTGKIEARKMKESGVENRQSTSLSAGIEDFCDTFERTVKPVVVSTWLFVVDPCGLWGCTSGLVYDLSVVRSTSYNCFMNKKQQAPDRHPGPDGLTDRHTHTHKVKPIHPRYADCNHLTGSGLI